MPCISTRHSRFQEGKHTRPPRKPRPDTCRAAPIAVRTAALMHRTARVSSTPSTCPHTPLVQHRHAGAALVEPGE